ALEGAHIGLGIWSIPGYSLTLSIPENQRRYPGRTGAAGYPVCRCKDGLIRFAPLALRQWDSMRRMLGNPDVLESPEWYSGAYRGANADILIALLEEYTMVRTVAEVFDAAAKEGLPAAPVSTVRDFMNNPQTQARGFMVGVEHPLVGEALYPGAPYKLSETPCNIRRPAPCLGEHNEDIYCRELGLSKESLVALRRAGVI
ncbi:MAG: CoA transferase, partial [Chloroflexi bacterium]|nr:CoA transferase [Chloroflexota bacterium]